VAKTWTINVGGTARNYKKIEFSRKLETKSPAEFSAKIQYSADVDFFDLVEIKRDGTTEWKGFVETIDIDWDDQGRYINIAGRDTSVVLWKKYCEGFTEMDKTYGGFFGQVSAVELIKFLLRSPQSDPVIDYPNNRQGWGMDTSKMSGFHAYRTSAGNPNWTRLRKRGYGWRNSGTDFNVDTLEANSAVSDNWSNAGSPPYLTVKDDANYIYSATADQTSEWNLENLGATASGFDEVKLKMWWKPDVTWWWWIQSDCDVYLWIASESRWQWLFNITGRDYGGDHGWRYLEFEVGFLLSGVSDVNSAKVKFINRSADLSTKITYCALGVNYSTSGTQHQTDFFDINFAEETDVVGVYVECRKDDGTYARNYKIVTVLDDLEDWSAYSEVDPNSHIALEDSDKRINHDNYQDETAYLYLDYGVDGLDNFDHIFSFKITSSESHSYCFIPWMVSNNLEDVKTARDTAGHYFAYLGVNNNNGVFNTFAQVKDSGGIGTSGSNPSISLNTTYYCRVIKDQGTDKITFYIYTSEDMEVENLLWSETFTLDNGLDFRYRFQGITYNGLEWGERFDDSFDNSIAAWTRNGATATTSFDSGVKIHGTHSWKVVADADEDAYVEKEITEADLVRVQWYDYLPSVPSESLGSTKYLAVDGWTFVNNDWTHVNNSPWIDEEGDGDYITCAINPANLGDYDEYYSFADIDSKYMAISLSSMYVRARCRLENPPAEVTGVTVEFYVWDGSTWVDAGSVSVDNTSWTYYESTTDIKASINTIAKINNARLKVVMNGISYSGDPTWQGDVRIDIAQLHPSGTAYWGRVALARIFDKDTAGTGNPSASVHGVAEARVTDTTSNQDKWKYCIYGWDDVGPTWSQTSTNTIPDSQWVRLRLDVYKHASAGYVKFYEVQGAVGYLKVEKTSLNNDGLGTPDCVDVEINCSNQASGTFYIDRAIIYSQRQTHTQGYIYSILHKETELVSAVSGNTFRDIIHSWNPTTIDNLRIKITANNETVGWSITQVYVYTAPDEEYRVYRATFTDENLTSNANSGQKDVAVVAGASFAVGDVVTIEDDNASEVNKVASIAGNTLTMEDNLENTYTTAANGKVTLGFPVNQYIRAQSFDASYSTPIGPLNIPMARLIDALNSVVQVCHTSYVPFHWWLAYDANNTFHMDDRRGSDKSGTVSFVKGTNLGGVRRNKSVEDTVHRLKIIGRGEGKRQEEVSSEWREDTDAMNQANTFIEDVLTEKAQADKDVTNLMADIHLEQEADPSDQSVVTITNDTYATNAYNVGDDVTVTDSLTGLTGAQRIYNIRKVVTNRGELVTIIIGKAWRTQEDEWEDIYRRLKEVGIVGTMGEDLSGEEDKANKVDAKKISWFWEQTSKHDEQTIGDERAEPMWWKDPDPDGGSPPTDGRTIEVENERLGMYGPSSGTSGAQTIEIEARYDKLTSGPNDKYNIVLNKEPKMVCEAKTYEITAGSTKYWNTDDFCEFGMFNQETGIGFKFRVKKTASGFIAYAVYDLTGSDEVEEPIRTITTNTKYRYEMYYNKKTQNFVFSIFDVENEETIPPSYIITELSQNLTLRPIYAKISGDPDDGNYWARFMIYKLRTEWTRVELP
jgi:hypothetical protein